ncbi:hypothetical protein JAAARDRAFT_36912 [Jaapia argillacea MUCL 33604]|uniref:Anaphase-promoting complex subunit 4 WD40 domain-containing protein n=1 Tax=Jaapia argillacea MUCL 33604 TaxID=933084 RepID=A0A067PXX5_9AGAM|nr:hypothetical protein JAAARDRAFT_36912 [Jaapia argillacea MUCL 33604]
MSADNAQPVDTTMGYDPSQTWSPPVYDPSKLPRRVFSTTIGMSSDPPPESDHNFARAAKWSPDGSVVLAQCENRSFRILDVTQQIAPPGNASSQSGEEASTSASTSNSSPPSFSRTYEQAAPILDFLWYPTASPYDPASYCFVASVRECPVKLYDAMDGRLRASYKIVDHRERQIAPHSLAFNVSASKLYCGFEDAIEVFDLHSPGEGTRLQTTPSKKTKDGLKGIISALAFYPSYELGYFAAGSLSPSSATSSNIALFSESTGEKAIGYLGLDGNGGGVRASVTQLQFNPAKPQLLYASFRRTGLIYAWDLRGNMSIPIQQFRKNDDGRRETSDTNQKMRFDVDIGGKWLAVGDQKGDISFFDLDRQEVEIDAETVPERGPNTTFYAHDDGIGSVAFHPLQSLLLSVSGSRHFHHDEKPKLPHDNLAGSVQPSSPNRPDREFDDSDASSSSSSSSSSTESEAEEETRPVIRKRIRPHPFTLDSSVKIWSFDASV